MTAPFTLARYVVRQFTVAVLAALAGLTGFVALFDFIDLLRRATGHPGTGLGVVTAIALLRLPYLGLQVLPFAVLVGGMMSFWRLTRSSELVVARAAGVSAWGFLAAPVAAAALLGIFATAAISPLSSVMFARANMMIDRDLSTGGGPVALNGGQLWLRQADRTPAGTEGVAILHAHDVAVHGATLSGGPVTVFRLGPDGGFLSRIEAASATLADGAWTLTAARAMLADAPPAAPRTMRLPTDLTVRRIEESFAPPDSLSVWQLPGFIALLRRSGFSSVRDRLHFQTLLALPLLTATMTLVAAGFSMRPARRGGVARMLGSGVAAGFVLFMIAKLAEQFGDSGAVPVTLAAWAPAGSGLMLALALLLHMEVGCCAGSSRPSRR